MTAAEVLDGLILVWLVGTWFYEGHHRRCAVVVVCGKCGAENEHTCAAGEVDSKPRG